MPEYVSPEIEVDPGAIRVQMVDDLEEAVPGLDVRPATPLYWLIAIFAFLWAQLAEQASQVFSTIFRYYGQGVVRIPQRAGVQAVTTVTFTASDADGPYDVPAGTEVLLAGADGQSVPFQTVELATISNGETEVTPVTVVAVDPGAAFNGLSTFVGVSQTFDWLDRVTVLGPSSGGEDPEEDDSYQDRLADLLTNLTGTLVRPVNFMVFARRWPGIGRALAINALDPLAPGVETGGHVTVFVADADGLPVSGPVRDELLDAMRAQALTRLQPHVEDPTYTEVTIVFEGVALPGLDPAVVEVMAEQAVATLISPAVWATPTVGDTLDWEERDVLYFQDVSAALNGVEGFDRHTLLTINGVAADLELDGPAALPGPESTVSGTVIAP